MPASTVFISHPTWHRPRNGEEARVRVELYRPHSALAHLVVQAPNWANALRWGPEAALLAYETLKHELPNPADAVTPETGLALWLVRPGFPKARDYPLWQEGFGWYESLVREAPWVYPLYPVSGTRQATPGRVVSLEAATAVWTGQADVLAQRR